MKVTDIRRKLAAALVAGGVMAPGLLPAASTNTNLLVNPGFETVDTVTLGGAYFTPKILNWTGPNLWAYAHFGGGGIGPDYANGGPLVGGGQYYFSAGHTDDNPSTPGVVYQEIDVSTGASGTLIATGNAGFQLGGFFSGYFNQPDKGAIHVDFLNAGGTSLGTAQATSTDPLVWAQHTTNGTIPIGTTKAKVSIFGPPPFNGSPSAYIDNVEFQVTTSLPTLSITVNRSTGAITLNNQTGSAKNISAYSITSAFEALNPVTWLSITDNYDSGNPGPNQVDAAHAWTEQTVPTANGDLTESDPSTAGASLANSRNVNLGNAWIRTPVEDLVFQYTSGGSVVNGIVSYVGGVENLPFNEGDLNTDGAISAADWAILRTNQHANISSQSLAEAYRLGDLNGDKLNNHADFVEFKTLYDNANGVGAFVAMAAGVPEPSSLVIVASAAGVWLVRQRRRQAAGV
jgi:hypothetical protein